MSSDPAGTERNKNIWAPWRMEYIEALADGPGECFLCHHRDDAGNDEKNLVLWRGRRCFAVLNRFPYTSGHGMVAPLAHVADLDDLDNGTMVEMMELLRDLKTILARAIRAEGFNIGFNIGRCAGAGLPGHLHVHIVPRWGGDTNFMAVLGGTRVIPQSLQVMYSLLRKAGGELRLPKL